MAPKQQEVSARQEEVAAYVATVARELQVMVEAYPMPALAYLLDLTRLEAETQARSHEEPDVRLQAKG
jgi:hypothetical protein